MTMTVSASDDVRVVTGKIRLCPWDCSSFHDATPSGRETTLTASPPTPDQPYGELVATMLKGGPAPTLAGGEIRLKQAGRINCDGTLKWRRTGCAEVTVTYKVPRDCHWHRTVIHPARPPFHTAHGTPDWEWRIEARYPGGQVVHAGYDDDSRWPRGQTLTHRLTSLQLVPGCRILAEEYYRISPDTEQTALQMVPFGTPTLTGGYLTGVVDRDARRYKAVVFDEEYTVLAGDWRTWENAVSSSTFVILAPNCLPDVQSRARPCPHTDRICSESDEFEEFGPHQILDVDDYIIVPASLPGVTPVGPAIHEYGPRDWAALLDAQVVPAVVIDRDLEADTADITF